MNKNSPENAAAENDGSATHPEDRPGEPGAEGGSASARDSSTPFSPHEDDDSALGDTDQHSDA
jgi:hypothetical protein